MASKHKIIIDTDPGVDDIMALLLALSSRKEDLELAMISVTYGNVPVQSCLRNTVALFHVLEKELEWRRATGRPEGYEVLRNSRPIVAAGAEHALDSDCLAADYFHGRDGLHNVHSVHEDLSPDEIWESLFRPGDDFIDHHIISPFFRASRERAHKEMLRILRDEPADSVTILAVGPMTNLALAAAEDPETFLRVKEVVVMGGVVNLDGNVTPVSEFNTYADPVATARIFALTSRTPGFTMPPAHLHHPSMQALAAPYPEKLPRRLNLTLCPLDITHPHSIGKIFFSQNIQPLIDAGSPLARWTSHFINGAFNVMVARGEAGPEDPGLEMHDPLTVWYMLTHDDPRWKSPAKLEDIRVETLGQWTRGMLVLDQRARTKPAEAAVELSDNPDADPKIILLDEVPGDTMGWLSVLKGNRIRRLTASPGEDIFKSVWMQSVFA